jgi:gamma-glutamylcyclotransferase (GGCT)/AIG2-like uncharacterized protein YtfP
MTMNTHETYGSPTAELEVDRLFVYGTLNNPHYLKLIAGQQLLTQKGTLHNHRRIHPKSGYPFALPWKGCKIEGKIVYGLTPAILARIDQYESEGTLYIRRVVQVRVEEEWVDAFVYIGKPKAIRPFFKKDIQMRDRIEDYVEQQVRSYLKERADRCLIDDIASLPMRVTNELLSEEYHSILRLYFKDAGMPSFIIKHELENANVPNLDWLQSDPEARRYADSYLKLATKFMIFNQLEERFRHDFRAQVKVTDDYYMHTLSMLMALKLLVTHNAKLQEAISKLRVHRYSPDMSYIDYAVAAIFIADELYTEQRAREVVDWVRENRHIGRLPIGAELEFSNLGARSIEAKAGEDPIFDTFYYFYDFDLMRRGWKLGAHVDDHGFLGSSNIRTRGFLELAFGRYKLLGDVSKPATQDPWILSQLIELSIRFMEVKPHSLHLSMQVDSDRPFEPIQDPEHLLCLLLLGGDIREDRSGTLRERRIYRGEILYPRVGVYFSRYNRHHGNPEDPDWSPVIEYQFPRLFFDYDYQPLIMALKGYQTARNPYPLKAYKPCPYKEWHDEIETALLEWSKHPTPVSETSLKTFLEAVEEGLDRESRSLGPRIQRYAMRILGRIEEQLYRRNRRIQNYHEHRDRKAHTVY